MKEDNIHVDVIILSNCNSQEVFEMNVKCLKSLQESEDDIVFDILILESNVDFAQTGCKYGMENVTVHVPGIPFNYNKFLNIGMSRTRNSLIAFCNNDLVFHSGWMSHILEVKKNNPAIRSFSPRDSESPWTPNANFTEHKFYPGYGVRIELVGWCFVVERSVFEEIGEFDERFGFYFQDDDFAMTLRKFGIGHALVPAAHVTHLGGASADQSSEWEIRSARDRKIFHDKWGPQRIIAWKNRVAGFLRYLGMDGLANKVYTRR